MSGHATAPGSRADGVSVYHGLAEGNGDLGVAPLAFAADFGGTMHTDPDIYGNLRGNPDLRF